MVTRLRYHFHLLCIHYALGLCLGKKEEGFASFAERIFVFLIRFLVFFIRYCKVLQRS